MEDTRRGIEKALSRDAGFAARFSEKINIPIFTSDELVAFARSYANELGYTIDEMGVLALYNSISNIQKLDQATTLTEVKDIVDEAIAHAERGGLQDKGVDGYGKFFRAGSVLIWAGDTL